MYIEFKSDSTEKKVIPIYIHLIAHLSRKCRISNIHHCAATYTEHKKELQISYNIITLHRTLWFNLNIIISNDHKECIKKRSIFSSDHPILTFILIIFSRFEKACLSYLLGVLHIIIQESHNYCRLLSLKIQFLTNLSP